MADTKERVIKIIANQFGRDAETITESTDIANDLGADSLELAELLLAFQEEFNIDIDDSETQNLATVGDVISQINAKVAQAG
ncbi:MAG: acyl carrier protein [Planctomycetaceae bacterium]|jgi:acyl carrier protein|nr:acyl carrier protein [Planctomycetaceae bacterium]